LAGPIQGFFVNGWRGISATKGAPSSEAMQSTLNVIEAGARYWDLTPPFALDGRPRPS
jgi:hypothetical protein